MSKKCQTKSQKTKLDPKGFTVCSRRLQLSKGAIMQDFILMSSLELEMFAPYLTPLRDYFVHR